MVSSSVLPLKVIARQRLSNIRADESYFKFLRDVIQNPMCPEYNGCNTELCRDQGQSLQHKTQVTYMPLIDITPSHPDTIMTAMSEAQKHTKNRGQDYVLVTCDMLLYKVVLGVKWAHPEHFSNIISA